MNPTPVVPPQQCRPEQVSSALRSLVESARQKIPPNQWLQMVLVILPDRGPVYNDIKMVAETQLNVITQCCQSKHVSK